MSRVCSCWATAIRAASVDTALCGFRALLWTEYFGRESPKSNGPGRRQPLQAETLTKGKGTFMINPNTSERNTSRDVLVNICIFDVWQALAGWPIHHGRV